MKKILTAFVFLNAFLTGALHSLSTGFDFSLDALRLPESPYLDDFAFSSDLSVFASHKFSFSNFFCTVKPGVSFSENQVKFRFYEFKNSLAFDHAALSFGKYNLYWGKAMIRNDVFPYVESRNPMKARLWNGKFDLQFENIALTLGSFFDTASLDSFRMFEWWTPFFLADFSNQTFAAKFSSDCKFISEGAKDLKASCELLLTAVEDFVFYADGSLSFSDFLKDSRTNTYSAFAGLSWNCRFDDSGLTLLAENGFVDEKYAYAMQLLFDLDGIFSMSGKILHVLQEDLRVTGTLCVYLKNLEAYVECQSKNLIQEENQFRISIGVKNEL